jgi:hypothetical protein
VKVLNDPKPRLTKMLWLTPGIAFIGLIYFAQGIKLRGIKIEAVDNILQLLGLK